MADPVSSATIAGLNHDFKAKRSIVILVWENDPDRRLFLPVPFGCSFSDLPAEAEKALRSLSAETATMQLHSA
jgi:hypothetical protein